MNNRLEHHMGFIVEKQVRNSTMSISEVAKVLGVNRRTLYNWFGQQRLKPAVVRSIGECIGFSFGEAYPHLFAPEPAPRVAMMNLMPGASGECIYKDKYLDLLEKYNEFLKNAVVHSSAPVSRCSPVSTS